MSTQKGFTVIESLLIVVILAIVGGTGYFVYHSKQQADKTLNNAQNEGSAPKVTTVSSFADCQKAAGSVTQQSYPEVCVTKDGEHFTQVVSNSDTQKELKISEWGIEAPYTGSDILTYTIDDGNHGITVISKNLANTYDCTTYGAGGISRMTGDEIYDPGPDTVAQVAKDNPTLFKQIGDYYYSFWHDQAACGNTTNSIAGENAQATAEGLTKSLISKLQTY